MAESDSGPTIIDRIRAEGREGGEEAQNDLHLLRRPFQAHQGQRRKVTREGAGKSARHQASFRAPRVFQFF